MIFISNLIRCSKFCGRDSIIMTRHTLYRIGFTLDDALVINHPT